MKLQDWANNNEPDEKLIYKNGYWDQIMFVRDDISQLFVKTYEEYKQIKIEVVSTHTSKSILLPVYKLTFPNNLILIMRYNFYDWKVSIDSPKEINENFYNLFNPTEKIKRIYFEGADESMVYESYSNNKRKFTVEISAGKFNVYTFLWLCARSLNINGEAIQKD